MGQHPLGRQRPLTHVSYAAAGNRSAVPRQLQLAKTDRVRVILQAGETLQVDELQAEKSPLQLPYRRDLHRPHHIGDRGQTYRAQSDQRDQNRLRRQEEILQPNHAMDRQNGTREAAKDGQARRPVPRLVLLLHLRAQEVYRLQKRFASHESTRLTPRLPRINLTNLLRPGRIPHVLHAENHCFRPSHYAAV